MDVTDANVCLLARQYSLTAHENVLRQAIGKAVTKNQRGCDKGTMFMTASSQPSAGAETHVPPTAT